MKKDRKIYEPKLGITWYLRKNGTIEDIDGNLASEQSQEFVNKEIARRDKQNKNRKEFESVMKDMGITKVRGSQTGKIYWE